MKNKCMQIRCFCAKTIKYYDDRNKLPVWIQSYQHLYPRKFAKTTGQDSKTAHVYQKVMTKILSLKTPVQYSIHIAKREAYFQYFDMHSFERCRGRKLNSTS